MNSMAMVHSFSGEWLSVNVYIQIPLQTSPVNEKLVTV